MAIDYNEDLGDFVWRPLNLVVDNSLWATGYPTLQRNSFVIATKTGLKNGYAGSQAIITQCIRRPALHI